MQKASKIFLIGFMGSGKSTTGRRLASLLGWSFIDLDELIENSEGMKIPKIFSDKGEDYFRDLESEALQSLGSVSKVVISTGGGTPCFGGNMDYMLNSGLTIYLKMSPAQLNSRLINAPEERPLITNIDKTRLEDFIIEKLAQRETWYNKAEIIFDGSEPDASGLFTLIMNRVTK